MRCSKSNEEHSGTAASSEQSLQGAAKATPFRGLWVRNLGGKENIQFGGDLPGTTQNEPREPGRYIDPPHFNSGLASKGELFEGLDTSHFEAAYLRSFLPRNHYLHDLSPTVCGCFFRLEAPDSLQFFLVRHTKVITEAGRMQAPVLVMSTLRFAKLLAWLSWGRELI